MLSKTSVSLRQINSDAKKRKLKILCCPTHESYATNMSHTGHEFYMVTGQGIKSWDFVTKPLPPNYYMYNLPIDHIRGDVPFDLILSQERFGQLPRLLDLSQKSGIPIIHLEHTQPIPAWPKKQFENLIKIRANKHVFITDHSKEHWRANPEDVVIPHGIDTDLFQGWVGNDPNGISVVNKFAERDIFCGWNLWNKIREKVPVKLIGDNPGICESAKSPQDLVNQICSARFFLNTSLLSPVPMSVLEALACGIPVVSTARQEIPKIIKHGVNGFLYDPSEPEKAVEYCEMILKDEGLARSIGIEGRKTILENFSMEKFVERWNEVFYSLV